MENEIPPVNRVDQIREELTTLQGQRLKVRANMGRSRIVERTGTLVNAHPSLFVIEDRKPVGIVRLHDCLKVGVA